MSVTKWISHYQFESEDPIVVVFDRREDALADAIDTMRGDEDLSTEERDELEQRLRQTGQCTWVDSVHLFIEQVPYRPSGS
jgi:hypothetical protein